MAKKYVGREEETKQIEQYLLTERSELIALYGRYRVGKTYLVRCTINKLIDFEFTGMYKASGMAQRAQFQKEINRRTGQEKEGAQDWFDAFDRLREYLLGLQKSRVVVFLDEIPWMDTGGANFLAAFSRFWNEWGREDVILKLFVCGSATTWMLDKMIGDRGGLYGRITHSIYLSPLTLREVEQYLNEMKKMKVDRKQVLDTYMIFGGIPFYLEMLDPLKPLSANIDALFFSDKAPLETEYEFLFR